MASSSLVIKSLHIFCVFSLDTPPAFRRRQFSDYNVERGLGVDSGGRQVVRRPVRRIQTKSQRLWGQTDVLRATEWHVAELRSECKAACTLLLPPTPKGGPLLCWAPVPGRQPVGLTCSLLFLCRRLLCSRSLSLTELATWSRRAVALSWPKMPVNRSFFSCSMVSCCFRRELSARAACGRQGLH